jgi:hypothetical protein
MTDPRRGRFRRSAAGNHVRMQPTPPRGDAEAGYAADSRETDPPDPQQERVEARRDVQEQAPQAQGTPAPRSRGSLLGRLVALVRR